MIHQVTNSRTVYLYNAYIYEDTVFQAHFHKGFELIYAISGKHTVFLQQEKYEIEAGELILIPPNIPHSLNISQNAKVWIGVFSADYISLFAKHHSHVLYSKFKCCDYIEEYLKKILFFQGTPEKHIAKSALYAVCSECLRNAVVLNQINDADKIYIILDYISANFDKPMTMKTMAVALGYEYHYFSKIFHACLSCNFSEFLNLYRCEKATDLLIHSEESMAQIAMKSGFQSIRSFNHIFKALNGVSPTEYRKSAK